MSDEKKYTDQEMKDAMRMAVIESKVEDMTGVIPEVFASLKAIKSELGAIPLEIINCRNKMDKDIKSYIHDNFITETELRKLETELELKLLATGAGINKVVNRAKWTISGFISCAVLFAWLDKNFHLFSIATPISGG